PVDVVRAEQPEEPGRADRERDRRDAVLVYEDRYRVDGQHREPGHRRPVQPDREDVDEYGDQPDAERDEEEQGGIGGYRKPALADVGRGVAEQLAERGERAPGRDRAGQRTRTVGQPGEHDQQRDEHREQLRP